MYSKATPRDVHPPAPRRAAGTPSASLVAAGELSPTERLDEVARLLALGILRLRARRRAEKANGPNHLRRFGLDFTAEGSVGDTDVPDRRAAE